MNYKIDAVLDFTKLNFDYFCDNNLKGMFCDLDNFTIL